MPFKSDEQRKYLLKNKPEVAKKFAEDSKVASRKSNSNRAVTSLRKKDKNNPIPSDINEKYKVV